MSSHNLNQRILGPYRLSHHPFCDQFKNHVYIIRGKKYCRGCIMQYSGMVISFIVLFPGVLFGWLHIQSDIEVGFVLYILILPTLITSFLIENRKLKDTARFLLGVSFILAFIQLVLTPDWIIKGWILLNFIPGYIYLNKKREKNNNHICEKCPEKNNQPNCTGYQIYSDRERIFLSQAISGGISDPFALPPDQLEE